MTDAQLADREHKSFVRAFVLFAETLSDGYVARHGGVVAAVTGVRDSFFNEVFVEESSATSSDLAAAIAAVEATGIAFSVHLRRGRDDGFRAVVDASNLVPDQGGPTPGMVLRPIGDHEMPPELEIRSGSDPANFESHVAVVSAAFDMPRELTDSFMVPSLVENNLLSFYAGYVDGDAVASSFGLRLGSGVTVFNVGTVDGFRGRGYGAAMTMRAALDGRSDGCDAAFLQSSPMGYPVYEKLGFRTVVEYDRWATPKTETPVS